MASVWYTIKPVAGVAIAVLCVCVKRGTKTPWLVLFKSKIADGSAVLPSLLMATDCALVFKAKRIIAIAKNIFFIMYVLLFV